MQTNDEIVAKVAELLLSKGWANVRSGESRSVDAARKLLKSGAGVADVAITTASKKGYVTATVK